MGGRGRGRRRRNQGETGFEGWGNYMDAKKAKLTDQFKASREGKSEGIFHGVSIFVNGYTVPSAEELKRIMLTHGGVYHQYYSRSRTTHIIASNLPHAKVKELKGEKIVKPAWISDSLKAGKLLDYKDYLMYALASGQGCLNFKKSSETARRSDPDQENKEASTLNSTEEDLGGEPLESEDTPEKDVGKMEHQTKDARNPNFISDFYANSRLHHISTMGAMFKQYVMELRNKSHQEFPGLESLKKWKIEQQDEAWSSTSGRVLLHVDMDCFFVSVGLRKHPELRGKPIAVTHGRGSGPVSSRPGQDVQAELEHYGKKAKLKSEGQTESGKVVSLLDEHSSKSEVASCSYEARKCGVRNGMFLGAALKLCPDLITIPYDFDGYKEVAYLLYDTVASYTVELEAVSCDELFADCSDVLSQAGVSPLEFAAHLRKEVKNRTGCSASCGLGPNLLIARLATKVAKPDGQHYVPPEDLRVFMANQSVRDLPGVGYRIQQRLGEMNIESCGQLQDVSRELLRDRFGEKLGASLYNQARGIDNRTVTPVHERKSVSAEVNYGIRFNSDSDMDTFLIGLSQELSKRLQDLHLEGTCLTLKLKVRAKEAPAEPMKYMGHGICDNVSKSSSLRSSTSCKLVIHKELMKLYVALKVQAGDLRGIGCQMTRLQAAAKKPAKDVLSMLRSTVRTSNDRSYKMETQSSSKDITMSTRDSSKAMPSTSKTILDYSEPMPCSSKAVPSSSRTIPEMAKIDMNVLAELPENIRVEIQQEYHLNSPPSSSSPDNPLSYSQIDSSFLEALPEDIRNELKSEYKSVQQPTVKVQKENSVSPKSKPRSPRQSPQTKRSPGIGRKRKKWTRAYPSNIPKLMDFLEKKGPSTVTGSYPEDVGMLVEETKIRVPKVSNPLVKVRKPNLAGCTELEEIKELLREWVSSSAAPLDEDRDIIVRFFCDLISFRNLELLHILLKYFKRFTWKSTKVPWIECYKGVVEKVQIEMVKVYEMPLKLET